MRSRGALPALARAGRALLATALSACGSGTPAAPVLTLVDSGLAVFAVEVA
jgi:hypothetical protein